MSQPQSQQSQRSGVSQQQSQQGSQQGSRPGTTDSQQVQRDFEAAINEFPRTQDTRKQYIRLEEFTGLEIENNLVCDLADHKKQPILFVCINPTCMAPRKLVCGYCNSMHADHLQSLQRIEEFRAISNKARGDLNASLADFTVDAKRNLIDLNLYDLIKLKQGDLIRQFETFLTLQHDAILKLIDANTENYLFEETEVLQNVGGFYEHIEKIFGSTWPQLGNRQINDLIKLYNTHEDLESEVDRLDQKRAAISKELSETVTDYFLQTEILLSDLELEATSAIKKLLDKSYNQGQGIENQMAQSHYTNLTTTKDKMSVRSAATGMNQDASVDFHSTLFKETHAPKSGWRTIDQVPLKYISMPYIEKAIKKIGKFTFKNAIAQVDVVNIPPVTNKRGDVYLGEWRNGLRWGKGEFWWKDGHYYVGTWEKGKPEGYGRMIYRNGNVYEGEFHEEKRHGKGIHYHLCGSRYDGQWKNDLPHGVGVEYLMNGDIFNGCFSDGLKQGKGELKGIDGSIITGWWEENKLQGKGEWLHGDKRLYVGEFKDDQKQGEGIMTWPNRIVYEGQFHKNRMHGIGIWTETDGSVRKGEWQFGKRIQWLEELKKGDSYANRKKDGQIATGDTVLNRTNQMRNDISKAGSRRSTNR